MLDETGYVLPEDYHVTLRGVDSFAPRPLISRRRWKLGIDAGLGVRPADFNAMILYRYPAKIPSDQLPACNNVVPRQRRAATTALAELEHRDPGGSIELAGTAGAAFVGAITACLAIAHHAGGPALAPARPVDHKSGVRSPGPPAPHPNGRPQPGPSAERPATRRG